MEFMDLPKKCICVSENEVVEFAGSQLKSEEITKPEWANKTVLNVMISYKSTEKEMIEIENVKYSKVSFDEKGVIKKSEKETINEIYRTISFIISFAQNGEIGSPLPIPKYPVVPTNEELKVLKKYLQHKHPKLLSNDPNVFEWQIEMDKEIYKRQLFKTKKSHKNNSLTPVDEITNVDELEEKLTSINNPNLKSNPDFQRLLTELKNYENKDSSTIKD